MNKHPDKIFEQLGVAFAAVVLLCSAPGTGAGRDQAREDNDDYIVQSVAAVHLAATVRDDDGHMRSAGVPWPDGPIFASCLAVTVCLGERVRPELQSQARGPSEATVSPTGAGPSGPAPPL